MGELDSYKSNCDYIRKTFSLPETTSLYAIVNTITQAYKEQREIKDLKQELAEVSANTLTKEKENDGSPVKRKRGRPAKRTNSN
jgi:hypothetical protein